MMAFISVPLPVYGASNGRVKMCAMNDAPPALVLSHIEAAALLSHVPPSGAPRTRLCEAMSIDIGMRTRTDLHVCDMGVYLCEDSTHPVATWREVRKMAKRGRNGAFECFTTNEEPRRIASLSETSGRALSLYPVKGRERPTLVIGGFGMHRFRGMTPREDTERKVHALRPFGRVLDVCTGLGYTALHIAGVEGVREVVTIEWDVGVVDIQRRNPWSAALFRGGNVGTVVGDGRVVVAEFSDGCFDCIMHDPPARALAPELYEREMYHQFWRVCKEGGRLFHYVGDPQSKEGGRVFGAVVKLLNDVGFKNIELQRDAFGVSAVK